MYDRGSYHDWFREGQLPHPHRRDPGVGYVRDPDVLDLDVLDLDVLDPATIPAGPQGRGAVPYVVDLDRDAVTGSAVGLAAAALDEDVS